MNDKPTQQQIAAYLNWLESPDGNPKRQMTLPLNRDIGVEASSDGPDYVKSRYRPTDATRQQKGAHSESESKSRIRCLAVAGMSIPEIAQRTGLHPRFVEAIIEPGRLDRRYE